MVTHGRAENAENKDRLWTVKDVAAFLCVSENTVRNKVAAETIPFIRVGALIRFDPADIRRWLEDQKEVA